LLCKPHCIKLRYFLFLDDESDIMGNINDIIRLIEVNMLLFLMNTFEKQTSHEIEEIYRLYYKDMFYVANNILKDYSEAENIVQTAIIKIANHLGKIKEREAKMKRAYVVLVSKNLAINLYNKRKSIKFESIDHHTEKVCSDSFETPENYIIRLDNGHDIAKKLANIKKEYADILTLRYTYDLTDKEISDLLDISYANTRKRLSRAKKALKRIMGSDQIEKTS